MGSPFTAQLCQLAAERLDAATFVGRTVLSWPGQPRADALPLRLMGALHALVLSGRSPELATVYPPQPVPHQDVVWQALESAFVDHGDFIGDTLTSPPQTNEVARSSALLGGFLTIASETGRPLALSELGASTGLNLLWDRFHYTINDKMWGDGSSAVHLEPEWSGPAPPVEQELEVVDRAACDLNPLNPAEPADRLRLLSYVWADQSERISRLNAAMDLAAAADVRVEGDDAASWIEHRLAGQPDGSVHVVYHTVFWHCVARATRERIQQLLEAAGAEATADRPLAWLRLEADSKKPGAGLTLTTWPEGRTRLLARADFHGRWVAWLPS